MIHLLKLPAKIKAYIVGRLRKIKYLVIYCHEHGTSVFITGIKLKQLARETGNSIGTLMMMNYLFSEKKDTYMLHNEYIMSALKVNDLAARQFMNDKGNLLKRCGDLIGRDFLILKDSSREEILEFIRSHTKFVSKVNAGSCGKGFRIYESDGVSPENILKQINAQGADILEGYIYQHEAVSEIYPKAVNTIRIHTVNNGKEVKCFLNPKMRFGAGGTVVDIGSKGYRLILNPDGTVKEAISLNAGFAKKAACHDDTGKRFSEVQIPFMEEMYELVKKAAKRCPETPYIGWDVAISQTGPVLIEGNGCSGCFGVFQIIHGIYHGCGLKKEILEMLEFAMGEKNENGLFTV